MKIVTVIGARPQFIKAASVSREFTKFGRAQEILLHTGQHFDENMSDIFFEELGIPRPKHNLGIGGGSHGEMTGRQLEQIEKVLIEEAPDRVLVYGDTNSTLAGALAAAKLHVPVAHVEAGLRSYNRKMPEEINRILTDQLSDKLFVPTSLAKENLIRESFSERSIFFSGDVMLDAALHFAEVAREKSDVLQQYKLDSTPFILTTIHRAENVDHQSRLTNIINGLCDLPYKVVLPLHPRTEKQLQQFSLKLGSNIVAIPPVGYLDMVMLEKYADLILTDSGGVQKEAYFHNTPCITLRDETEWVELVEAGYNVLADVEKDDIPALVERQITIKVDDKSSIYGDGSAANKIVTELLN